MDRKVEYLNETCYDVLSDISVSNFIHEPTRCPGLEEFEPWRKYDLIQKVLCKENNIRFRSHVRKRIISLSKDPDGELMDPLDPESPYVVHAIARVKQLVSEEQHQDPAVALEQQITHLAIRSKKVREQGYLSTSLSSNDMNSFATKLHAEARVTDKGAIDDITANYLWRVIAKNPTVLTLLRSDRKDEAESLLRLNTGFAIIAARFDMDTMTQEYLASLRKESDPSNWRFPLSHQQVGESCAAVLSLAVSYGESAASEVFSIVNSALGREYLSKENQLAFVGALLCSMAAVSRAYPTPYLSNAWGRIRSHHGQLLAEISKSNTKKATEMLNYWWPEW